MKDSTSKRASVPYALIFLLSPLLSFSLSIRHFRSKWFRYVIAFLVAFLGFTSTNEGDLEAYKDWFYERDTHIESVVEKWINLESSEFYVDSLEYVVGIVFDNHRFYFAFLFGIFGFLLASILYEIYSLLPQKLALTALFFLIGVALYYSIRSTLSMRFYTGSLFYLLMIIRYIKTEKVRYLFLSCLAPFFHIGLAVVILSVPVFFLLSNNHTAGMVLVILTFFVSQTEFTSLIEKQTRQLEYVAVESRVHNYVSEEGREYMANRYAKGASRANWKLNLLNLVREIVWQVINFGIVLVYLLRKKLLLDRRQHILFSVILIFWSISNVMLNVSNGDRYIIIYTFLTLALFLIIYANQIVPWAFEWYIRAITPLVAAYGIMLLYAANPLFTANFFLSNFFYEFILLLE